MLLQTEAGLIVLLCGAVLFGIVVVGALSLSRRRATRANIPHSTRKVHRERPRYAEGIVSWAARAAPTDAHMAMRVAAEGLRRLFWRLK